MNRFTTAWHVLLGHPVMYRMQANVVSIDVTRHHIQVLDCSFAHEPILRFADKEVPLGAWQEGRA